MELNMKECGKKANNMVEVTFFSFIIYFDCKNGFMIFQGKCVFSDGSQYEGDWKRGLIHGNGNKKIKKGVFF